MPYLVAGGLGLLLLYRLLRRLQRRTQPHGKVVVVTGASSGLGGPCTLYGGSLSSCACACATACARAFHAEGARLVLCGRDLQRLESLRDELSERGPEDRAPRVVPFDLGSPGEVARAAERVVAAHGRVDVLVSGAGISYRGEAALTAMDVHRQLMEVNYFGAVALLTALLPSMLKQGEGHIVAISSVQGRIAIPFRSAYAASKHATQAYFDSLRAEVADSGLKVTVVSPGYIRTNLSLNALTADGTPYHAMDANTAGGRSPDSVAQDVVGAVLDGRAEVVSAGLAPTAAVYLRTLLPSLYFILMARRARSDRKKAEQA
ncbi:dehydrogenase/reductase SDR family member 7B-like [Lethenteron reissneri]|uniref:dehydrogenase/reductase SDR family member 7B-like n=1 Tax=Lethenteron reissneri TaxID=7753 RepID=UPI002AB7C043|nr:dehydrogenase/reductase SDR family member 7B-like [Lethenteron reissneri]